MAKPGKAIKRSARAVERLSKKTSERLERVQTAIDGGAFNADQFAREFAGQGLDALEGWLGMLRSVRESPPSIFIDITISGNPGGTVTKGGSVALDETVGNIGVLQKTELINPADSIPAARVTLTNPAGAGALVDDLQVDVEVDNDQAEGLYQGVIFTGSQAVQVELRVNVHT